MRSNIESNFLPKKFLDFFRTNRSLTMSKIEDILIGEANNLVKNIGDSRITNVIFFEYLDNLQELMPMIWKDDILKGINISYKLEFGRSLTNNAIESSYRNFLKEFDKSFNHVTKQILRWSLDLSEDDLFKVVHLSIQNLKGTIRKSIHIIQDSTVPPLGLEDE
ncbi:MAG: hypothetical protein HeimC3_28080 [Candidatus Heimdallarchaeota archaeon LC_3]|nr:MAG: hypothetical protein HeimC3_28080 [Candidatus Heimdallarchaeota archaeon LC_3]